MNFNLVHPAVAPLMRNVASIARISHGAAETGKSGAFCLRLRHFWSTLHMRTCFLRALRHRFEIWS